MQRPLAVNRYRQTLAVAIIAAGLIVAVYSCEPNRVPTSPITRHARSFDENESSAWPNQPAGWTVAADYAFNDSIPAGSNVAVGQQGWQINNPSGLATQITNATDAPLSPPNVGQWSYPIGFQGGSPPATMWLDTYVTPGYAKEAFVGVWFKVSSPWQDGSSGVNEILRIKTGTGASMLWIEMHPTGGTPAHVLNVETGFSGIPSPQLPANVNPTDVTLGNWHRLEWYLKYSTTSTSGDGVVSWYLDGALQGNYGNVNMPADAGFGEFQVAPSWDGSTTKTEQDYMWFDHLHIASAPTARDSVCEATGSGRCYYITNVPGTGSGSFANPYRMGDLPNSNVTYCDNQFSSTALSPLQPGDVLYFRAGVYQLSTCNNGNWGTVPYIRPARSGLSGQPITIKAYPGEHVQLMKSAGTQAIIGNWNYSYLRVTGFTITLTDSTAGFHSGVDGPSQGVELSYCEFIGADVATMDNHDGVRLQSMSAPWVHHNIIRGVQGQSQNSAGLKLYSVTGAIVEDNYIHDNTAGIFDKQSPSNNTYRRNYLTANSDSYYGNNQGTPAQDLIYDNVIDGQVNLHYLNNGTQVYSNLIRGDTLAGAWMDSTWNSSLWNNIVISGRASIVAYYDNPADLSTTPPHAHLAYMDYNVYDAPPSYLFGSYTQTPQTFSQSDMQGFGFEAHASVASASTIFQNQSTYQLNSPYLTAGRYGDPVGPDSTAQILTLSRYGPAARP